MSQQPQRKRSKKLLWIDDDYYHLRRLMRGLEKQGFRVVPARSYMEAKSLLERWNEFDVVILDLILPYSETELTAPARRDDEETNESDVHNGVAVFDYMVNVLKVTVPIILLSVVSTRSIVDQLMSRGVARRLEKLGLLSREVTRVVLETLSGGKEADSDDADE